MAGTVTFTKKKIIKNRQLEWIILTGSFTCDSEGSFDVPATAINAALQGIEGFMLTASKTMPGETAPTNAYTIDIKDADGAVLLTMTGSATVGVYTAKSYDVPVTGNLSFTLSGNSVASAVGTCELYFCSRMP